MRCRRLDSCLLVLALAACAPADEHAPAAASTGSGGATRTGGAGDSAGGTGGTGGDSGSAGHGNAIDAAVTDAADEGGRSDGAPDTPLVVIHDDAASHGAPCPIGSTAVGSNRLRAGGRTPTPFATAYNAELDASSTAGPMLLALYRADATKPFEWVVAVGGLAPIAGGGVGFVPPRAEVSFTLSADRALHIGPKSVDFALRFATAPAPSIAVASFALEGVLSAGCGAITVERATLLVPTSAGAIVFRGSTVAALMGNPTEALDGVPNGAWRLELAGTAAQVYAPGWQSDGGIEP